MSRLRETFSPVDDVSMNLYNTILPSSENVHVTWTHTPANRKVLLEQVFLRKLHRTQGPGQVKDHASKRGISA